MINVSRKKISCYWTEELQNWFHKSETIVLSRILNDQNYAYISSNSLAQCNFLQIVQTIFYKEIPIFPYNASYRFLFWESTTRSLSRRVVLYLFFQIESLRIVGSFRASLRYCLLIWSHRLLRFPPYCLRKMSTFVRCMEYIWRSQLFMHCGVR